MRVGLIIVIVALAFATYRALKTHFVCPKCGENFKVSVFKYIFAIHFFSKRMARCPSCGHIGFLVAKSDKK